MQIQIEEQNGEGLGRRLRFSFSITFVYTAKVLFYLPSFPIETDWADEFPLVIGCRRKYRSKSTYAHLITGIIVTGMIVTPLTLVVGGVLSQQNGKYVLKVTGYSLLINKILPFLSPCGDQLQHAVEATYNSTMSTF